MLLLVTMALFPLVALFALIVFFHRSVVFSALVACASTVVIGYLIWYMELGRIGSAIGKAGFISTEIIAIVFFALILIESIKKKNLLISLKEFFEWVSQDYRVHIILVAWSLMYFLEGVAGFGTPALIAVPLLIALGFTPLVAVSLALIGNSVPVSFGAIGLPIIYGVGSSLGATESVVVLGDLGVKVAVLNLIGSIFIPLALIVVYAVAERKPMKHVIEIIPFSIVIGVSTALVAIAIAYLFGPELPSVIAGLVSIVLVIILARYKVFLPKTESDERLSRPLFPSHKKKHIALALTPYAIVIVLLLLSRMPWLPFGGWLRNNATVAVDSLFGFSINYTFYPLYSVGFLMTIAAICAVILMRFSLGDVRTVVFKVIHKVSVPYLALFLIIALVQIFMYSGDNVRGIASMPLILAQELGILAGPLLPLIAPFVGALGSFVAGSATVSNLLFTEFQYQSALMHGYPIVLILALQVLGAAAGNMVALHNIVAAFTVAEIEKGEAEVIKRNGLVLLLYLLLIGMVGLFVYSLM